jgi:DNA-directed RNA polymerase subunit RPC12/RpoP
VTDLGLIRHMRYALKELKSSVLLYPEAGYSFDGTGTTLPDTLGGLVKMLDVPVVMIRSRNAFLRDPLYNNLQKRRIRVTAEMEYLLSREEIAEKSAEELQNILAEQFSLDAFAWQRENGVRVEEKFRADGLERVLYKCPECGKEGHIKGEGTRLACGACGKEYELTETGELIAIEGVTEFDNVPDWYAWERRCVSAELRDNAYAMETEVDIYMLVDTKGLYRVGEGTLTHGKEGFCLCGCGDRLTYTRSPIVSYSLNADFNFYEIGDVICIGDVKRLYYCFPKDKTVPVAKARLATEELYRLLKHKTIKQ